MKKKIKVVLSVILIMIAALIFIDWYTAEPRVNSHAKKLLSEKYNEEFEVLDTWGIGGKAYDAECYPKRDRTILFEGTFELDNSEFRDEYDEAVFSKKVREKMQPRFDELFQECYVYQYIMSRGSGITKAEDITIESFVEATEEPRIYFGIGVNSEKYRKTDYQTEFRMLAQYMEEVCDINLSPSIDVYFLPNKAYKKYAKYYKNNAITRGGMDEIVGDYPNVGFAFRDGKPNISESEYVELRKEQ